MYQTREKILSRDSVALSVPVVFLQLKPFHPRVKSIIDNFPKLQTS